MQETGQYFKEATPEVIGEMPFFVRTPYRFGLDDRRLENHLGMVWIWCRRRFFSAPCCTGMGRIAPLTGRDETAEPDAPRLSLQLLDSAGLLPLVL